MSFDHEPAGYQVCLCVGPAPAEMQAARCIDVSPTASTEEAMLVALRGAGLDASDLRAKTLLSLNCDAATACLAYVAVSGFAGRRIDVLIGSALIEVSPLHQAGVGFHTPRPTAIPETTQVGAVHASIPSITLDSALTPATASDIRWSRRLRFVPPTDAATALSQLVVVAAIRNRPSGERLPMLCDGTEAFIAPGDSVGIDLDHVRTSALELRRSVHSGDRDAVADLVPVSPRHQRLADAAAVPVEEALLRLGGRHNEATDLWHCPRPERHTHGDATASMRIQRGRVRCYRCDAERVDSLRLAMDARALSVDEAADWLLDPANRLAVPVPVPDASPDAIPGTSAD